MTVAPLFAVLGALAPASGFTDRFADVPRDVWLEVLGRAHPVVLHLPFGVIAALVVLEVWGVLRRRALEQPTRAVLVGVLLVTAAVAATSGWFLGREPDYRGEVLATHRNLGIGMAATCVLVALAAWRDMRQMYGVALGVALLLLLAAGHQGGSMAHGEGFLFEPIEELRERQAAEADARRAEIAARREVLGDAAVETAVADTTVREVDGATAAGGAGTAAGDTPARTDGATNAGAATALTGDASSAATVPVGDATSTHAATVVADAGPLLVELCSKCHGAGRQKGGLALHEPLALLAGGDSGPAVVPGNADASLLVQRLRLPLDDDDHMPPESKRQPTTAEVAAIAAWVDAGMPRAGTTTGGAKAGGEGAAGERGAGAVAASGAVVAAEAGSEAGTEAEPEAEAEPAAEAVAVAELGLATGADRDAADAAPSADPISALRDALVHVEVADPASGALWVDFRPRPATDDAELARLLDDLPAPVEELGLAGTAVGDEALAVLGDRPALRRLDLSRTAVTAAGLAALASCPDLEELDLTGTAVGDEAVEPLARIPALRRVHLWGAGVGAEAVARLRAARPDVEVRDGGDLFAAALEQEPEPVLRAPAAAVNTVCPVSGAEADPTITREHDGAVVAFCCGDCPDAFLADPAAFPVAHAGPRLGAGAHVYEWVPDWLRLPDGQAELGNTHGEVVVDRAGNLYINTDTEQAVMVFAPDGTHLRSWGAEFANGLHGMCLVEEDDGEFLYFVHFGRHEYVKATLTGEIVWRRGPPEASGKYASPEQFRPTSIAVAPDGGFFVADGYGEHWVHQFDADGTWVRALGGPGSEPGRFQTPHGVWVDTRGAQPVLVVADRENNRLQRFDMDGELLGVVDGMLRRPCKIQQRGEYLVVPDLAGRVTILDGDDELVTHLGDNPDPGKRANNGVPREAWADGEFLAPHSAVWDADGNLYVMDWNRHGRVTMLRRIATE